MKTSNATYLVKKGISSVWKNWFMSLSSFSILTISLLMVSCMVLLMMNVNIVMGNIEDTNEITIYLEEDVTAQQIDHINSVLSSNDNLTDIRHYSKEDALEDFRADMAEYADLLDYLDDNPMPETFLVRVTELEKIRPIVDAIGTIDGVEKVKAPYDFASVLVNIRHTFTFIGIIILAALIFVSIVVVSSTIRISVHSRRNEINIMKYVGATNTFVKVPFFVEGMFVGVLAGVAGWALTWLIYENVNNLFSADLTVWSMFGFTGLIPFDSIIWPLLGINCIAGATLAAIGTVYCTGRYVKV